MLRGRPRGQAVDLMRAPLDRRRAIGIALGGVAGAASRWAVLTAFEASGRLPWPVLIVNVVGSALLGLLLAEESTHPRSRLLLHDAGAIGFCGGLTTFSTFALEEANLLRDDAVGVAVTYGLVSVTLSIAGVIAGAAALRRVRSIALPLEEQP